VACLAAEGYRARGEYLEDTDQVRLSLDGERDRHRVEAVFLVSAAYLADWSPEVGEVLLARAVKAIAANGHDPDDYQFTTWRGYWECK
jgi:hypothetical protein